MVIDHTLQRTVIAVVLITISALVAYGSAYAEDTLQSSIESLRDEVRALREAQQGVKHDLGEIKKLLERKEEPLRKDPAQAKLLLNEGPAKGEPSAKIVVVEFSDYECPFCAQHFRDTLPKIERDYISTGKIRYLFRNFPIESRHKNAMFAAEAGLCAGDQGKYWEMHDFLFTTQGKVNKDQAIAQAKTLRLELGVFQRCLDERAKQEAVRTDLRSGTAAGVTGTPAFFIGRAENLEKDTMQLEVYRIISGAEPYETFQTAIDSLLQK